MKIYRLISTLILLALALESHSTVSAFRIQPQSLPGRTYYVGKAGKDTNPGSRVAPFRTFARAASVIGTGDTLIILPGTYYQPLKITKSGASGARIIIRGPGAVINLLNRTGPGILVTGSHVWVSGLEVKNSAANCVDIRGNFVTASTLKVHECRGHGINTGRNSHITIRGNIIYHAVLSNRARATDGGWDSGIKVRMSKYVLIRRNRIHHNYGEGMATRGTSITIQENVVFDNFSVNIYTNSENARIERNFIFCTPNSGFERNGKPAAGIGLGEEYYAGWGARLKNARVINNIVTHCKSGVRYIGAEAGVIGGGLKYSTVAYNTFYDSVDAAIGIVYEPAQAGNLIANNIVWQGNNRLIAASGPGFTFKHNLWKVRPPVIARGFGDRIANPGFVAVSPGNVPSEYRIRASSAARGGAANINILQDFFGARRSAPFDMGAAQFGGGSQAEAGAFPMAIPLP